MLKISRLADYAIVLLAAMDENPAERHTAASLSLCTTLPEPTVAKLLKQLARADFLNSTRGANGGYSLDRSIDEINVASVVEIIDGPIALTACVVGDHDCCDYSASCVMKGRWDGVNEAVRGALEGVMIGEMMAQKVQTKKKAAS